jgi:hypothetical protein
MATTQDPKPGGTDFWATLGVWQEDDEATGAPKDEPTPGAPGGQSDSVGPANPATSANPAEFAGRADPAEPTEPAKAAEPAAPAKAAGPAKAAEAAEAADESAAGSPGRRTKAATTEAPSSGRQAPSPKKPATGRRPRPAKNALARDKPIVGKESGASKRTPGSSGKTAPAQEGGSPDQHAEWAALFSGWSATPSSGIEGMSQPPALPAPIEAESDVPAPTPELESPKELEALEALEVLKASDASDESAEPAPPPLDPAWRSAERLATEIQSQLSELWFELLVWYAGGDRTTAYKIYHVLGGQHLLGELWMDKRISEVHIRGTRVTVCSSEGIYEAPGFPSLAAAAKAVQTVTNAKSRWGAVVTYVGESVVLSRTRQEGPGADALLASGLITEERLSEVRQALERMQAVTISGPAARIVMRAFASLIPAGSRVFEGPLAVLPARCVAAGSPLDADYVIGVRPGTVAEEMAAAGHVGAIIANPETRFRAAVHLVVSGPSAAPKSIAAH